MRSEQSLILEYDSHLLQYATQLRIVRDMSLLYTIISTLVISLGSLAGVITLAVKRELLHRWLLSLVAISAGTMLGAAMFHLLPEAAEGMESQTLFGLVTISFVVFFLIEKVLHWRHCHEDDCEQHSLGIMNLLGDSVHNLIDGLVIGAAYATSPALGLVASIAVISHEIPQEIGDFGVLLHSGWSIKNALIANFLVATTSVMGGIIGFLLTEQSAAFALYLTPIAAGGFLYIAASDLIPELRQEKTALGTFKSASFFLLGLLFMFAMTFAGFE